MTKYDFNLVVIGAGSGGLVTALVAAAVKAKVALVEKHKMGGDCLNTGCVPSKALIRSAKLLSQIKKHKKYGINEASANFDFADVMERVQRVIKTIEPHDSVERFTSLGVDCFQAVATIKSPHEVEVDGKILSTANIVIATGAGPFIPPIPGLDKIDFLHTDNLWEIRKLPQRLIVLGGGPIGCELAQCFARFGSQVTQVEMGPSILGREDEDVIEIVQSFFEKDGINLKTNFEAKEVVIEDGNKFLVVSGKEGEMIGKTDYDFHTPYQAERYIEEDHKVIESGSALPNQIWLVPDFKGTLKWFLSTKIPMFDLKRKVIGIAGVMRDYENVGAVLGQYQDMSEVIQFIMDHYREKIPVATLAKISHLSVSQFDRKFKQLFKCTPTTYITQIRINIACQDLVRTDDNLSLIAQRAGFYDHSYFIKQFKSIIGLTPKAYREKFNRPE